MHQVNAPDWLYKELRVKFLDKDVLCSEGWSGFTVWMEEKRYLWQGKCLSKTGMDLAVLGLGLLIWDVNLAQFGEDGSYPEGTPDYLVCYEPGIDKWEQLVGMCSTVLAFVKKHLGLEQDQQMGGNEGDMHKQPSSHLEKESDVPLKEVKT